MKLAWALGTFLHSICNQELCVYLFLFWMIYLKWYYLTWLYCIFFFIRRSSFSLPHDFPQFSTIRIVCASLPSFCFNPLPCDAALTSTQVLVTFHSAHCSGPFAAHQHGTVDLVTCLPRPPPTRAPITAVSSLSLPQLQILHQSIRRWVDTLLQTYAIVPHFSTVSFTTRLA